MSKLDQIGQVFGQFFNVQMVESMMRYTGYILLVGLVIGLVFLLYLFMQYKYKIYYPILLYDSDGNSAQVLKMKKDYARVVKRKDGRRYTHYLLSRKKTEPLKQEHIKPGNKVYMMRVNDDGTYTPLPSFQLDDNGIPFKFESLTQEENTWAILELKETAEATQTEEAQKRIWNYTVLVIVILGMLFIGGLWLTLKYTGNVTNALQDVTPTLAEIARGLGSPP